MTFPLAIRSEEIFYTFFLAVISKQRKSKNSFIKVESEVCT